MNRDDSIYLRHIIDAIEKIENYSKNLDAVSFYASDLVQDACIRQLLVIGEAAKAVSASIKIKYSAIPWNDMAGMRDKLVHQYFGIDFEKVWLTIQGDLPSLKAEIEKILQRI